MLITLALMLTDLGVQGEACPFSVFFQEVRPGNSATRQRHLKTTAHTCYRPCIFSRKSALHSRRVHV